MENLLEFNETYIPEDYSLLFNESSITVEELDCMLRYHNKTYSEDDFFYCQVGYFKNSFTIAAAEFVFG
ncbi:hypothetical protein CDAR_444281 [Caerostris darwini]|uniref:Uncharacterized protein n=1 Tax=Caerostris darwini TaxID=1538125 RepID=A0AAV4X8D9_9ARAC|nr:hypothetical protein CDAR_444281 [Caerostris darwini]